MDEDTLEPFEDGQAGNRDSEAGAEDKLASDDVGELEPVDEDDDVDEDDGVDEDDEDEDDDEDDDGDDEDESESEEDELETDDDEPETEAGAEEPEADDDGQIDDDDLGAGNAADDPRADDHVDDDLATVASGATIEDAKRKALEQLRKIAAYVNEAEVQFIVLDEGQKGGFLGMGRTQPRVEARLSSGAVVEAAGPAFPPAAADLREFLEEVISLMGLEATIEASETAEAVSAEIAGDDLGILIGRHGQTLDALQYLSAIVVNGDRRQRRQVIVDAEGYRQRRESSLKALAERTAHKVSRGLAPVTLQPMTAAERKIIHLHLKDHPRVETASEGQEPYRAVVVSPRRRS